MEYRLLENTGFILRNGEFTCCLSVDTRFTDQGVGFLYINSKAKVQPLILGGGQQNGMRSGTDNVPGIAGLGVAAELSYRDLEQKTEHLYQLKERLAEGLSGMEDVVINGMPLREGAPHIMSVSFLGIRSEVLSSYIGGQRYLCICRKCLLQP